MTLKSCMYQGSKRIRRLDHYRLGRCWNQFLKLRINGQISSHKSLNVAFISNNRALFSRKYIYIYYTDLQFSPLAAQCVLLVHRRFRLTHLFLSPSIHSCKPDNFEYRPKQRSRKTSARPLRKHLAHGVPVHLPEQVL